ncbi:unnamed protein product [Prorocentrum cordatum]|uniref:Uncharacterized protein n=1 Tax=Prorocentrum cordatum TaxID=2364126 RepID=A0ABN9XI12_9DINO|nr:unnamed protein product [Polarella glacialis]
MAGDKWWNRGDLISCALCSVDKGASFGGANAVSTSHSVRAPRAEQTRAKQHQEQLQEKDLEIARLREQLHAGGGAASAAAGAEGDDAEDPDQQKRLMEIESALKEKPVRGQPFAGPPHHYTARIEALEKQRAHQRKELASFQQQRELLDVAIADTEKVLAGLDADIQEPEAQRWQVRGAVKRVGEAALNRAPKRRKPNE